MPVAGKQVNSGVIQRWVIWKSHLVWFQWGCRMRRPYPQWVCRDWIVLILLLFITGVWKMRSISYPPVCYTGPINHEMANGRQVPWCDSLPSVRGWQRSRVWMGGGRLTRLAAVLIFSQQPSYILSVIEPGNIRLHESFPVASWSAHLVLF